VQGVRVNCDEKYTAFCNIFCTCEALATPQAPDFLIYNGDTLELNVNPLEECFERNTDCRLKDALISSSIWRGYIATFGVPGTVYLIQAILALKGRSSDLVKLL
jgi:hypothetical protein